MLGKPFASNFQRNPLNCVVNRHILYSISIMKSFLLVQVNKEKWCKTQEPEKMTEGGNLGGLGF